MKKKASLGFLVVISLALTGCLSTGPSPEVIEQPLPEVNTETIQAFNQLSEIKEEMKQLRNAIEEMQFKNERDLRQQADLVENLTRRIESVEQVQQHSMANAGSNQSDNASANGNVSGAVGSTILLGATDSLGGQSDTTSVTQSGVDKATAVQGFEVEVGAPTASSGVVTLGEQASYDRAFELLKQSLYEDAINEFQVLADTWPNGGLADDAHYWMSEARYVNREFEIALSGFRTVVTRYPDSQRVPEAMLKIGYIEYDIGAYEAAAETFKEILARFPGHQVAISAKTRLRRIETTIQ